MKDLVYGQSPLERAVRPGTTHRHYKYGRLYRVLSISDYTGERRQKPGVLTRHEQGFDEGEKLVTYLGLYDNPHGNRECSRPLYEWIERVEAPFVSNDPVLRYTPVEFDFDRCLSAAPPETPDPRESHPSAWRPCVRRHGHDGDHVYDLSTNDHRQVAELERRLPDDAYRQAELAKFQQRAWVATQAWGT